MFSDNFVTSENFLGYGVNSCKDISQELTFLEEFGSEVSHFIPEPGNFSEVKKLSDNIKKPWLKANTKAEKESNQQSDFPN